MVVEYVHSTIPPDQASPFQAAWSDAGRFLDADPHCPRHEVAHGVEKPERWIIRIEWDTIDGHEQGFQASPAFLDAVRPFMGKVDNAQHYQPN
jgi:heme-degrading monooxygenase HmoA